MVEYVVIGLDGKEYPLDLENIEKCKPVREDEVLKQFVLSEEVGKIPHEPPPHVDIMRRLEIADYEPASDVGHLRFYPKGALMRDLIADWVEDIALELGAMIIETPTMYRADMPDIREQAEKFLQKEYKVKIGNKILFLRFAGDFGLFRMMKTVRMHVRQLPIRVFELSPSYRLETRRECVGLRRQRMFTMPDIHCFCKDIPQAFEEFRKLTIYYSKLLNGLELNFAHAYRIDKAFYEEYSEFLINLTLEIKKPALVQILPKRKHYWALKNEFQFVDSVGKNVQLSTVQVDVEDSERYGITYIDEDGSRKGCIIVHSSPGSIERLLCAILEKAASDMKAGVLPKIPTWLSPTQVRIIPVADRHMNYATSVLEELTKRKIRVDIDDRKRTVEWRIRQAGIEWIPYVVVVGDKETEKNTLMVTIRAKSTPQKTYTEEMTVDQLAEAVINETNNMPFRPLYLPKRLSMRPKFR